VKQRRRPTDILPQIPESAYYSTSLGVMLRGLSEEVLVDSSFEALKGKVNLIFTSPPFPLNKKKKYGNLSGNEYLNWITSFGSIFKDLLSDDGSIVMELGNSWEPGLPVFSTLGLRTLLKFLEDNELFLCQEIICHNPARLPGPASWVTVDRIRLKDSFTRLWWMSPTPRPKANNKNVLSEYSPAMKRLIETKKFNAGDRPSEHRISTDFFAIDNGGSISPNVLIFPNTNSNDSYQSYCRANDIRLHPARMQIELPTFFIKFLTEPGDTILDPFGGSNTTGKAAETLGRHWVSIEPNEEYILGSMARFNKSELHVFKNGKKLEDMEAYNE